MALYSTVWNSDPEFNRRVTTIDWRYLSVLQFERSLLALKSTDVLIINGAVGFSGLWRDVASAVAATAVGRRFGLVISDATWEPRSLPGESRAGRYYRANNQLTRFFARRLAGDRSIFCFLSQGEVDHFRAETSSYHGQAVFTPFTTSVPRDLLHQCDDEAPARRPMVFSGGNTLRDWPLLCDALGGCGLPVRVATKHVARWPPNFIAGPCSRTEFFELASSCVLGVLALRHDIVRSCGQQTYLNLLRLATPVVINEAPGVLDHLVGVPGAYITPSDPAAMADQVASLLNPDRSQEVRAAAEAGRQYVKEHFDEASYLRRLVDEAATLARHLLTPD